MPWRRAVFMVVLGSLVALTPRDAHAQALLDNYSIQSWDERDGLSPGRILAITQDADGYLWLGTESGLVRFDGLRFVQWTPTDASALPVELSVSALHAARDGSLWVGLGTGEIGRIRDGELTRFDKPAGLSSNPVQFFAEDRLGLIWAGDPDGMYVFREKRWEAGDTVTGLPRGGASHAYEDRAGNFWLATTHGIFVRYAQATRFQLFDGSRAEIRLKFSEDSTGRLWSTDALDGFRQIGTSAADAGHPGYGFDLVHDQDDTLWVATGQGLWRVLHERHRKRPAVQPITVTDGLSSDRVPSVFADRDGHVWVGTDSGLHRITARRIMPVFDGDAPAAVAATSDGSTWIATANGVIRFIGNSQQRRYGRAEGVPAPLVRALFTDAGGTLWVATDDGVARRVGDHFERLPSTDAHLPPRVFSMASDSRGRVWIVARERGAFQWENGHFVPWMTRSGLSGAGAHFVYVDRRDRLWVGLPGGRVAVIDSAGSETVHTLGSEIGTLLSAIYEDQNGVIWIGGTRGLARVDGTRVDTVGQPAPLPGYGVFAITQDEAGDLWLGVSTGLIRLRVADFELAARDPRARFIYQFFDSSDGLVGVPARRGFPGAARAADGELWFTTSRGASMVRPLQMARRQVTPALRIERVTADDRPVVMSSPASLPPGTSRLLFEYTSVNLTSPMTDRFQYRLEGVDAGWVPAGTRREAFYPNLRSGHYRFHVARLTDDTDTPPSAATFEFSIRPRYYETGWFMFGCIGAAIAMGWMSWRIRLKQLRHQFALVFAERARMSRELHDTLLQDLVGVRLHFNDAAAGLETSNVAVAGQMVRLGRYLDQAIREARQAVWDLRAPASEAVDLATVIRNAGMLLFRGRSTQFEMIVEGTPRPCSRSIDQHLVCIAKEAMSNAAWHAAATSVRVSLEYRDEIVTLTVVDNGRGCDPVDCSGESPGHYGFLIMKERAEQAGGRFRVDTRAGGGTLVEVSVPTAATDVS